MSSWHSYQLRYVFGLGGMFTFYGIVGLIVYSLPPDRFGITEKLVILALVLITLPFFLIISFVMSRRARKRERLEQEAAANAEAAAAAAEGQPQQRLNAPVGSFDDVSRGAEE